MTTVILKVLKNGQPVGYVARDTPCGFRIGTRDEAAPFSSEPRAEDASNAILAQLRDQVGVEHTHYCVEHTSG